MEWTTLDFWIVSAGILASLSCALLGNFLICISDIITVIVSLDFTKDISDNVSAKLIENLL